MIPGIVATAGGRNVNLWTPADIATQLWLDAADTATVTTVSDLVSLWDDKSGNGRHFGQSTAANRPSYTTNTLDGKPVITFDGSNDRLERGSALAGFVQAVSAVTLIAVRRYPAAPTTVRQLFSVQADSISATRCTLEAGRVSQRNGTGGRRLDADSFAQITEAGAMSTGWQIHAGVLDYANSDAFLYMDGSLAASSTSFQTAGTTTNTTPQAVRVGSAFNSTEFFLGDLAELVVYHGADTATRQLLEGYLAWQWGLEGSLPVGHPYASAPPMV